MYYNVNDLNDKEIIIFVLKNVVISLGNMTTSEIIKIKTECE